MARISVKRDKKNKQVTIVLSEEDFDHLAEAVYFTADYSKNNYGSGWERNPDDQEKRRIWRRVNAMANKFTTLTAHWAEESLHRGTWTTKEA